MSNNENLAADAVASRVLNLAGRMANGGVASVTSILGADLGFDELDCAELVMAVEEEFEVDMDEEPFAHEIENLPPLSVQDVIDATVKALAAKAQPVPAAQVPAPDELATLRQRLEQTIDDLNFANVAMAVCLHQAGGSVTIDEDALMAVNDKYVRGRALPNGPFVFSLEDKPVGGKGLH